MKFMAQGSGGLEDQDTTTCSTCHSQYELVSRQRGETELHVPHC